MWDSNCKGSRAPTKYSPQAWKASRSKLWVRSMFLQIRRSSPTRSMTSKNVYFFLETSNFFSKYRILINVQSFYLNIFQSWKTLNTQLLSLSLRYNIAHIRFLVNFVCRHSSPTTSEMPLIGPLPEKKSDKDITKSLSYRKTAM